MDNDTERIGMLGASAIECKEKHIVYQNDYAVYHDTMVNDLRKLYAPKSSYICDPMEKYLSNITKKHLTLTKNNADICQMTSELVSLVEESLRSNSKWTETFDIEIAPSGSMAEKTRVTDSLEHDYVIILKPKQHVRLHLRHQETISGTNASKVKTFCTLHSYEEVFSSSELWERDDLSGDWHLPPNKIQKVLLESVEQALKSESGDTPMITHHGPAISVFGKLDNLTDLVTLDFCVLVQTPMTVVEDCLRQAGSSISPRTYSYAKIKILTIPRPSDFGYVLCAGDSWKITPCRYECDYLLANESARELYITLKAFRNQIFQTHPLEKPRLSSYLLKMAAMHVSSNEEKPHCLHCQVMDSLKCLDSEVKQQESPMSNFFILTEPVQKEGDTHFYNGRYLARELKEQESRLYSTSALSHRWHKIQKLRLIISVALMGLFLAILIVFMTLLFHCIDIFEMAVAELNCTSKSETIQQLQTNTDFCIDVIQENITMNGTYCVLAAHIIYLSSILFICPTICGCKKCTRLSTVFPFLSYCSGVQGVTWLTIISISSPRLRELLLKIDEYSESLDDGLNYVAIWLHFKPALCFLFFFIYYCSKRWICCSNSLVFNILVTMLYIAIA